MHLRRHLAARLSVHALVQRALKQFEYSIKLEFWADFQQQKSLALNRTVWAAFSTTCSANAGLIPQTPFSLAALAWFFSGLSPYEETRCESKTELYRIEGIYELRLQAATFEFFDLIEWRR